MKKIILLFVFFLLFMPYRILIADDALSVQYHAPKVPLLAPVILHAKSFEPNAELVALAKAKAFKYQVSYQVMAKIVRCESGWRTDAHNPNGEDSWGLVQINLRAHKDIAKEQATDPDFALDFLAKNLSKGHGKLWTCYTK